MATSDADRGAVAVRRRRSEDIPVLAKVLFEQQSSSRYPFRDPLPIPVEQFLHATDAEAAWTAELDGRIVGHICRVGPPDFVDASVMNKACLDAHGCTLAELAWVSTLFVSLDARGAGVGRLLLDVVLEDIRAAGRYPCLEVLLTHEGAFRLYQAAGWQEVTRLRPQWLLDAAGDDAPEVVVMILPS